MVRYILDKEKRRRILKLCHLDATSGHMGVKKTLDRVTEVAPGVVDVYDSIPSYSMPWKHRLLLL